MPRTPVRLAALAAAAVSATLLAACGSDSESASNDTVSSASSSAPSSSMGDMTSSMSGMTSSSAGSASSSGAASSGAASSAADTITISNFNFGPPLTVKPGATITVVNKDSVPHDVDSDDGTSFDTSPVANGTFTFTAPTTPGSYGFFCSVHPNMKGTLIVAP